MSTTFDCEFGHFINAKVSIPSNVTDEEILKWGPFKDWLNRLNISLNAQKKPEHPFHESAENKPYYLRSIDVQAVDRWQDRIGFMKLNCDVSTENGDKLSGGMFLRGPAVAILLLLKPNDPKFENENYAVMTVQPRIPTGSLCFPEIPAGMIDGNDSFAGTAARELEEEVGIKINEADLIDLHEVASRSNAAQEEREACAKNKPIEPKDNIADAMYPSAGGCDERIKLYLCQKTVTRDQLQEYKGKLTGLADEGERITLKIVPFEKLWYEGRHDSKALSALALYRELRAQNLV